jgi:hypothetical protein
LTGKRMKLIDNFGQAWQFWSVRLAAVGASASAVWLTMTEEQRQGIMDAIGLSPSALSMLTFLAVIAGRVLKQTGLETQRGGGSGDDNE